ncbi:hypothetical protein PIB30_047551 [Stylosanthes scabra]|uniref:Uncharacterized protein n=1 Tax=Stylosanthes scabra TaxID=79078 RepID=A0ABU6THT1_9FABA|nr:hypothetical protein [Stylosanthes scabra]
MDDSLSVHVGSPAKFELSYEQPQKQIKLMMGQTTTFEPQPSPSIIQKGIAEIAGTYILIFCGCGAALVNQKLPITIIGIAIVSGLALTVAIYSVGHVSGGHFNPAVTIALAVVRKFQLKLAPVYVMCQLVGSTLATMSLKVLYHGKVDFGVTLTKYTSPTSNLDALLWEIIITSILMFTICGVATDHRGSKDLAGVAIGIAVLINIVIAGPTTGASMNPARSLGPAIVLGVYKNVWVYIIGPTLGAILASMVYMFLRVPQQTKP